jgi:3,4-dihydroxy 2-butanone 4-phosphate synthase/GTP cyclohydrolase II
MEHAQDFDRGFAAIIGGRSAIGTALFFRSFESTLRMTALSPVSISPVEDIVADMRAGRMVILVDEEDRENEGDLVLAADHVTAEAINFMAKFGRGLICLTLTRERCELLKLPPMATRNGTKHSTAFTVSIEAAEGVTTGISAADRARTVQAAVAKNAVANDLVQPGHIFPLQAVDGGVLMRAGHTEAGCDLSAMAGCTPAAVICEIMKDDGTMARLPDLQLFAAEHGLKIGTIADLIEHRSRNDSLIEKLGVRPMHTAYGEFIAHAFRDTTGHGVHLALVKGSWDASTVVPVRVHEPLSVLDALEINRSMHSWSLDAALAFIANEGKGVLVLLNCGESGEQLLSQFEGTARASQAPERGRIDLRTYGIGAQILLQSGVQKMQLMGSPRRMPSLNGYGLEITGYICK